MCSFLVDAGSAGVGVGVGVGPWGYWCSETWIGGASEVRGVVEGW